ncbi:hypothetical protein SODG_003140 [Sodalis praecaptivus]
MSASVAATPANGAGQDSTAPLYRLPPLPTPAGDGMTGDDAMASDAAPRKEDALVGSGGNNAGGAASDTGNRASSDNGDNRGAEAAAKSAGSAAATGSGGDNAGGAAATGNGELPFDFPPPTVDVAPDAGAQPAGFPWRR